MMRSRARKILTAMAAALLLDACGDKRTSPPVDSPRLRADGFLVILRTAVEPSRVRPGGDLRAVAPSAPDARIAELVPAINAFVVRGVPNASSIRGPEIEAVVPNYVADITKPVPFTAALIARPDSAGPRLGTDQTSAFFFATNAQWSLKRASANRAWRSSGGGAGASVCIVDSGIDAGHSAFAGKVIRSTSFVPNSSAQTDSNGHGSHVAGTVSTNGVGGASVAPRAALLTAKIFDANGNGGNAAAILNAVAWCADNGADVVNVSLGFSGGIPTTPENQAFIRVFQSGLDYATTRGVLIVAAAGNEAQTLPAPGRVFLPAEARGVTSVAATGPAENLAPFGQSTSWAEPGASFDGMATYSNRGPEPGIDLAAPGGDFRDGWPVESLILSVCSRQFRTGLGSDFSFPCADDGFFLLQGGTSQAAAHVAGAAAIVRGRLRAVRRSPALRDKIESCLYRAVDNVSTSNTFGRGRVNVLKAATQAC